MVVVNVGQQSSRIKQSEKRVRRCQAVRSASSGATAGAPMQVGHIVEDPGGIAHLIDVEVPTEYYYEAYGKDLSERHPKASPDVHEHMRSLAVFLDTSILSGV